MKDSERLYPSDYVRRFEHKIHQIEEGEPLTATRMNDEYAKLNKQYFGECSDQVKNPSFLYESISYATGYSASLSHQILTEGKPLKDILMNS